MALSEHRRALLRHVLAAATALPLLAVSVPHAFSEVGVTAAVNVDAKGRPPGGQPRVLSLGEAVIFNERIDTDARGLVQILLLDGTTFTVGPNSQLTIDEFVYDPDTGDAKVVASVTKGAFRFIGGQTSKKPGGATIRTPVGTIGIRGAMVEGNVDTAGNSTLFSMIFGNEVLFNGIDGSSQRIFQPGYTLTVAGGAGGGLDANIRPRTKSDAATFQTSLAGKPGQSGGARSAPTDTTVATSAVAAVNSQAQNAPIPTARPNPVQSNDIDTAEQDVADIDTVTQQQITDKIDETVDHPPPEPPPPGGTKTARVLTAGDTYTYYGETIADPGIVGLVGGSPETDRTIALSKSGGRLVSADGAIDLPDITGTQGDTALQAVQVTDALIGGVTYAGTSYAGVGDFATYLLGANGNPQRPFYAIYGAPTNFALLDGDFDSNIREYSLTRDSLDPSSPVPFFAQDIYGLVANYSSTNLLAIEPQDPSNSVRVMQTWVDIQGSGIGQKSAAFLFTGNAFADDDGVFKLQGGRRGSFRDGAFSPSANMRGGVDSIAGTGGSHFFGPNADNFVVGPPADPPDAFSDSFAGPVLSGEPTGYDGTGIFGSYHVASLVSDRDQSEFGRTSRSVSGFMSGLGEAVTEGADNPYALSGVVAPNLYLTLDAQHNSVFAFGAVYDRADQNPVADAYILSFGAGTGTGVGDGGNSFIDDDRFAASFNDNPDNTRLLTDGGGDLAHAPDTNPGSYLISGRAAPIEGYQHCARCTFVDWGWWGMRGRFAANGAELPEDRTDYVHMGTWVVGDITNPNDLPTNLTATYSGTALGSVARTTDDGVARYIATGDMNMSYDFSARSGTMSISNFDGMNVSGAVADRAVGTQALFGGDLSGAGLSGSIDGAFVNNGPNVAAGVIGNFGFSGAGVNAVGTVAGAKID